MIDVERWAIRSEGKNGLVGNKYSRSLWKVKPTNVIASLECKAKNYYGKELNLVAVKVRVTEIKDD